MMIKNAKRKTKKRPQQQQQFQMIIKQTIKLRKKDIICVTGQIGTPIDMIVARTKFFKRDEEEKIHTHMQMT